jgi:pimeloyl-ACP methyl ester carboxylesterase
LDWPQDIVAFADSLAIERFAVVGFSAGGAYALACAYKIPDRLESFILFAFPLSFHESKS